MPSHITPGEIRFVENAIKLGQTNIVSQDLMRRYREHVAQNPVSPEEDFGQFNPTGSVDTNLGSQPGPTVDTSPLVPAASGSNFGSNAAAMRRAVQAYKTTPWMSPTDLLHVAINLLGGNRSRGRSLYNEYVHQIDFQRTPTPRPPGVGNFDDVAQRIIGGQPAGGAGVNIQQPSEGQPRAPASQAPRSPAVEVPEIEGGEGQVPPTIVPRPGATGPGDPDPDPILTDQEINRINAENQVITPEFGRFQQFVNRLGIKDFGGGLGDFAGRRSFRDADRVFDLSQLDPVLGLRPTPDVEPSFGGFIQDFRAGEAGATSAQRAGDILRDLYQAGGAGRDVTGARFGGRFDELTGRRISDPEGFFSQQDQSDIIGLGLRSTFGAQGARNIQSALPRFQRQYEGQIARGEIPPDAGFLDFIINRFPGLSARFAE